MLDINLIRANPEFVAERIAKRGIKVDFDELLEYDEKRREYTQENEKLRAKRNAATAEIATMKKQGAFEAEINKKIHDMQEIGEKIAKTDKKVAKYEEKVFEILAAIPNMPDEEVTAGGKEANQVVKTFGQQRKFNFKPKDHVELCTSLGLINYELGAKMAGSGHWVYTGMGARLEWALLNYFIDFHVANGYTFVMPPHLLNYESGYAAGQFPKFEDDVFFTNHSKDKENSRFLLPTSETALVSMHGGEVIPAEKLPIKYAAYSPCYRREAGGYGQSERGMIRGHQFNKIEMFIFCAPADSPKLHAELVANAEKLVEGLGLHYQTVKLAAGDTGAAMAKTFDIELWIPSMNGYKECSSASNGHCYQTRRANIRTKTITHDCGPEGCKKNTVTEYVHALNASGLATSRLVPAIVEQFQNEDGSVTIPMALRKYLGGMERI